MEKTADVIAVTMTLTQSEIEEIIEALLAYPTQGELSIPMLSIAQNLRSAHQLLMNNKEIKCQISQIEPMTYSNNT